MRFYTVEIAGREEILVGFRENEAVYRLNLLARLVPELAVADMNELICRYTPEVKAKLERLADNDDVLQGAAVKLAEVKLLAPIVHPRQDVVCLGINYDAHAQEAGRFSSEAFGGERPYTIYFSKRVNRATASGESIPRYEGLVDSLDYEAELSEGMTLAAGTIIATGTPAGVGMGMKPPTFLQHGDKIICSIEKIGSLENVID